MIDSSQSLKICFLLAVTATLGSLYASEILGYPPCALCWYQRIALYPLMVIFGIALWTDDKLYTRYSLPLAGIGILIAAYHNLLYYGLISEGIVACQQGVSCKSRQVEFFGFLTIPMMSLLCFVTIYVLNLTQLSWNKGKDQ